MHSSAPLAAVTGESPVVPHNGEGGVIIKLCFRGDAPFLMKLFIPELCLLIQSNQAKRMLKYYNSNDIASQKWE